MAPVFMKWASVKMVRNSTFCRLRDHIWLQSYDRWSLKRLVDALLSHADENCVWCVTFHGVGTRLSITFYTRFSWHFVNLCSTLLEYLKTLNVHSVLHSKRERAFLRAARDGDQRTIAALLDLNTNIDYTDRVSIIISMIIREDQH